MKSILPLDSSSQKQTVQTTMDGISFTLQMKWSLRDAAWYLRIYDVGGNPLLMGRKIVAGELLLARFHANAALPPGEIIAIDLSGQDLDPQATVNPDGTITGDLGTRVVVYYIDAATMAAAEQARASSSNWAQALAAMQASGA